jgi:hypothetical protein
MKAVCLTADGGGDRLGVFEFLLVGLNAANRRLENHDNNPLAVFEGQERAFVVQDVEYPLLRVEEETLPIRLTHTPTRASIRKS